MKLLAVFLLAASLHLSANTYSQKVTYKGKEVTLKQVFTAIKKQTGYTVFVNVSLLDPSQKISLSVSDMPLEKLMGQILDEKKLTYSIQNKTIVISPKEDVSVPVTSTGAGSVSMQSTPPPNIDVKGRVVNEKGEAVVGASIKVKGTNKGTTTKNDGAFSLSGIDDKATLVVTSVNIETLEIVVNNRTEINIVVKTKISALKEVEVVSINTGYQQIPRERSNGSFTVVDQKLLERNPAPDIISRLQGVTNGLLFNSGTTKNGGATGITIRGTSTISPRVNKDPLIVVDNFPYEGDISSINPNDIASVTILKDAVAASVWGTRSGNGVIVITTKRGLPGSQPSIEFNMNRTFSPKPSLGYSQKFLSAPGYIDAERFLFDQGFYNQPLNDRTNYPAVSPVVEMLNKHKLGQISGSALQFSLDSMSVSDIRRDAEKYYYRPMASQQYSLNIRGGATNISYYIGLGYDKSEEHLQRNNRERFTLTSVNIFTPVKNLQVTGSVIISLNKTNLPNNTGWGVTQTNINRFYPYASVGDASGTPIAVNFGKRTFFQDSLSKLGFLDWAYRPLEELYLADNQLKQNSTILRGSVRYAVRPTFNFEFHTQIENQSSDGSTFQSEANYAVRLLINRFSAYDPTTATFTYRFPRGGILQNARTELNSSNFRVQTNYNESWNEHSVNAMAGGEIRETKTSAYQRVSYGYSDRYGASVSQINYTTFFPTVGGGSAFIPPLPGGMTGTTQRFISYYALAGYTYKKIYSLNLTARKDGANLFGVRTNDRVTPLWSIGVGYDISREKFYNLSWLPILRFRTTYGFNGNVYRGAAYLTATYGSVSSITNLPYGNISTAPNSELRWERVRNLNFGMDFGLQGNRVSGSLEYYIKQGIDLVQDQMLAPSTGFNSYQGNSASTRSNGLELFVNSLNIDRAIKWSTTFIFNYNTDKVTNVQNKVVAKALANADFGEMYPGNYILGIYSYPWAGIDPANGDPIGFVNKVASKNYTTIVNDTKAEDLVYSGSARPLFFGSIRNTVSYQRISISANITYKMKYFFRRNTTSLNYQDLGAGGLHSDYYRRWTKPGDENNSSVPSLTYVTNLNRNIFYRNSSVNIEKGDHIRLTDIAINYDVPLGQKGASYFKSLQLYGYINNIGILWRANKVGLDPDWVAEYVLPTPISYTLGIRANF